jgi:hypothetical protein
MTGTDVEKVARDVLNDEDQQNYRWDSFEIVRAINAGVNQITRDRPDAMLAEAGTLLTITPITATTGTISIADEFKDALAQYVVHWLLMHHDGQTENRERAVSRWSEYRMALGMVA